MKYLLDTHIWIWYVLGSPDLPKSLRLALDDSIGRCWLAPISIWETFLLVKKNRLRIQGEYQPWINRALEAVPVQQATFTFEVARKIETLTLPHGDPADHIIAATALVYGQTLVTVDENLVHATWLPTLTR